MPVPTNAPAPDRVAPAGPPADPRVPAPKRAVAWFLIAVMAAGSIFLWLGIPVLWLWIGSMLQKTSDPKLGPYILILVGIIGSMIVTAKALARLNLVYERMTGRSSQVRVRMPWHRSMRGERDSGRPRTVLDIVMVISVSAAAAAFGFWFFFLAGSPF